MTHGLIIRLDYIYEYAGDGDYGYGQSIGRVPKPERIIYTLDDYRERHATYRSDLDLQLSHATFPWIPVWDDHEVKLPVLHMIEEPSKTKFCTGL